MQQISHLCLVPRRKQNLFSTNESVRGVATAGGAAALNYKPQTKMPACGELQRFPLTVSVGIPARANERSVAAASLFEPGFIKDDLAVGKNEIAFGQ